MSSRFPARSRHTPEVVIPLDVLPFGHGLAHPLTEDDLARIQIESMSNDPSRAHNATLVFGAVMALVLAQDDLDSGDFAFAARRHPELKQAARHLTQLNEFDELQTPAAYLRDLDAAHEAGVECAAPDPHNWRSRAIAHLRRAIALIRSIARWAIPASKPEGAPTADAWQRMLASIADALSWGPLSCTA